MGRSPSSGFNEDLLKEAIADAKAVRATALANAKSVLEQAFGPYNSKLMFEADIGYPPELHQLIFEQQNPWDWPKHRKEFTPMIYMRAAIEGFKKCLPAERRAKIGDVLYKFQLFEFSLIEKNTRSVNWRDDYSFIGKIKVVPHRDCDYQLRDAFMSGRVRFWYKGEVEVDEKTDEVTDIILQDIVLKETIKANP